jgi:hypothetical protein
VGSAPRNECECFLHKFSCRVCLVKAFRANARHPPERVDPSLWQVKRVSRVAIAQSHDPSRGLRVSMGITPIHRMDITPIDRSHPLDPLDLADAQEAWRGWVCSHDSPAIKAGQRHSRGRQIRACQTHSRHQPGHETHSSGRRNRLDFAEAALEARRAEFRARAGTSVPSAGMPLQRPTSQTSCRRRRMS